MGFTLQIVVIVLKVSQITSSQYTIRCPTILHRAIDYHVQTVVEAADKRRSSSQMLYVSKLILGILMTHANKGFCFVVMEKPTYNLNTS